MVEEQSENINNKEENVSEENNINEDSFSSILDRQLNNKKEKKQINILNILKLYCINTI